MRLLPALMLVTSAISLAACGGGASEKLLAGGISNNAIPCPITDVDSTPDANCVKPPDPVVAVEPDKDGDGTPDKTDNDGETGSGAGGNDVAMSIGNKAIVLKSLIYDKPTSGSALSGLLVPGNSMTQAEADELILGSIKPTSVAHFVDTKSAINTQIAKTATQNEYIFGTRDLGWLRRGQRNYSSGTRTTSENGYAIGKIGGIPVSYNGYPILDVGIAGRYGVMDPTSGRYKISSLVTDSDNDPRTPGEDFLFGELIDHTEDRYWNQLTPLMTRKVNGGAGTNYREYRVLSDSENRDELLQLWSFGDSYASHYQNASDGKEPKHQVWAFGGRKAQNVPTTGTASFNGRWVGTAKTENWVKPLTTDIDPNALWRVEGNSNFDVNYDTGKIRGTLSAETWESKQGSIGNYIWFAEDSGYKKNGTVIEPDYSIIYETKVKIDANMDAPAVAGGPKNTFTGTANLTNGFLTGDNPVHGGFFGANGTELTGVFNASGTHPSPIGGSAGVTDNTRGILKINGAFNADCLPNVTCAP